MDIYEKELKTRGTKFFGGSKPGFVDYMMWPWVERIDIYPFILGDKYEELDKNRFSKFLEWRKSMKQDPAVKATILPGEVHFNFFQSYFRNKNIDVEQVLAAKL